MYNNVGSKLVYKHQEVRIAVIEPQIKYMYKKIVAPPHAKIYMTRKMPKHKKITVQITHDGNIDIPKLLSIKWYHDMLKLNEAYWGDSLYLHFD